MFISNIKQFSKEVSKKKIIGLDIGKKKIGLATLDLQTQISFPVETIKKKDFFFKLLRTLKENTIKGIVIGIPYDEDGKITRMGKFINNFSKNIDTFLNNNNINIPIFFWDESYSSFEAEDLTKNFFKNKKEQKKQLDKFAAKLILDDFLSVNNDLL